VWPGSGGWSSFFQLSFKRESSLSREPTAGGATYSGLFLVTVSTLMFEILLTRIFSVSMWYHFAFVAISLVMFGMTLGAIGVYLLPMFFTADRVHHHLASSALLFAISIVFSFLTHLSIPFVPGTSIVALYSIGLNYTILSIPFFFSGICVSLGLTKFPTRIGRLYAVDLAGAAAGCPLVIYVLDVTDGPTAVIVVAMLACLGALAFAKNGSAPRVRRLAIVCGTAFAFIAAISTVLSRNDLPPLRLLWVKGEFEPRGIYTKWNSFSRIRIDGNVDLPEQPFGWGLSPTYPHRGIGQLILTIDATASTVLTNYRGNLDEVDYLKYDVTNVVHYLRPKSRVLVVGVGGGRDILSALVFNQQSVIGLEINPNIIDAVNRRFGDFTGHLDRLPNVTFVEDEARSYIARMRTPVDIIQVSLIDTWAATTAGAFTLTENSLYTVEAWKIFLTHLSDRGVLSFSRWYLPDQPAEVYRLMALAAASLEESDITQPRRHIMLIRALRRPRNGSGPYGVGTILVSKTAFTSEDIETVVAKCKAMGFDVVLSPTVSLDPIVERIASRKELSHLFREYPLDITPPTDNSPFFFHMLRLRDALRLDLAKGIGGVTAGSNLRAVLVLGVLLVVVLLLSVVCIIVPLLLSTGTSVLSGAAALVTFFVAIGLGFMLVEISQMQRLIVFLGHPTYGLSVVLFALLLSSGLGSVTVPQLNSASGRRSACARLALLVGILFVFGLLTPALIDNFKSGTTPLRILIAILILLPIGFFMGMAFPMGMGLASKRSPALTPWLWGINGAMSVLGSVLAVVIALSAGISNSFWAGCSCYAVAAISFVVASLDPGAGPASV
jgi:hypothetical protein